MYKSSTVTLALILGCASQGAMAAQDPLDSGFASAPAPAASAARGVLRPVGQATLASDIAGRILEMPFNVGQSFKKGDVLVRFDCAAYQAQLSASQAASRAAQEELAHNRTLAQLNSVGKYEVALAQAQVAKADAESQVYQVQVSRCRVSAPYDGRVVERKAQPFESVAGGAPVLQIIDTSGLEVHVLASSKWAARLKTGSQFSFTPDETGVPFPVQVKRLGSVIDEGSQTMVVIGAVPDAKTSGLLPGMSGSATFEPQP